MNYFICYDISDDDLRGKMVKLLQRKGCKRVQKSVFLAPNFQLRELAALRGEVERKLVPSFGAGDSVLCIPVERDFLPALCWHGCAEQLAGLVSGLPSEFL